MAIRNLEVVITVTDKASKDLDKVGQKVRQTGDQAKKAAVDFTGFNRTLFATTAFVGTFLKAFNSLGRSFEEGAQLDRLSNQFERILGPKSHLSNMILSFTDTFVDEMEAMRQGIALKSLGIVSSTEQVAEIFSRASVAAKQAGKESGEGIKQYADFLKDGNVSHLQFLNLIAQTNPALQAQMAILGKTGGVLSNVVSTQARLALGQRLLFLATKDSMKGNRDLTDTLRFLNQQWTMMRGELGRLFLTALQPVLESTALLINKFRIMIDNVRANEKHLVFLTKVTVIATGAILGLAGALGTLRLATIALSSLGFGLPRLLFLVTTLGTAFLGITNKAEKMTDKLRVFGAFVKGVWQLVTSLDTKTGIAKIDEDIKQLLEENGIMVFAQNVARAISVVKTVVGDMINVFKSFARATDALFGNIGRQFINVISKFKDPWENFWVGETATPMQKFIRSFAVFGSTLGTIFTGLIVKNLLGKTAGLLSKIPVVGSLFGDGKRGPKGTSRDPIYIRAADSIGTGIAGAAGNFAGGVWNLLKSSLAPVIALFGKLSAVIEYTVSYGFQGLRYALADSLIPIIRTAVSAFTNVIAPVLVFGSAIYGAIQGIMETAGEWGKFFKGIADLGVALGSVVMKFLESIPLLKYVKDTLVSVAKGIFQVGKFLLIDGPMTVMKLIAEGWKQIFGWLGIGAGKLGESMTALAKNISPDSFGSAIAPETPFEGTSFKSDNTAGQGGEKTNISIPQDNVSPDQTVDSLGEQLKGLNETQRKQAQKAVEDALRSDSAGGAAITADEMELIMKSMQNKQIDLLGEIADNTRPIKNNGSAGSRRE